MARQLSPGSSIVVTVIDLHRPRIDVASNQCLTSGSSDHCRPGSKPGAITPRSG